MVNDRHPVRSFPVLFLRPCLLFYIRRDISSAMLMTSLVSSMLILVSWSLERVQKYWAQINTARKSSSWPSTCGSNNIRSFVYLICLASAAEKFTLAQYKPRKPSIEISLIFSSPQVSRSSLGYCWSPFPT